MKQSSIWIPYIGQKVRAKIRLESNLVHDGMGVELCANAGEELIVRDVIEGEPLRLAVSHPEIKKRSFMVLVCEVEPIEVPEC